MDFLAIKALIQDTLNEVEEVIDTQINSPVTLIKEISTHLLKAGGKRIRPMLVILVNRAYGCKNKADVLLGAGIELIHAATLLHDDVVDNSQMRRNVKTANTIWDNAASVLIGDFLYSRAFQLIVMVDDTPTLSMLAEATNIIATGEVLQLQNRHNPDITEANYLDILRYKTGGLFSAATKAGATLAFRPKDEIIQMGAFGEQLGIAFQLIDDRLDFMADEKTLGKNVGDDLADGKITLPLLHALQHAPITERDFIRHAIMEGDRDALPRLQKIIQTTGGLDYTLELALSYAEKARKSLEILGPSAYREALMGLTDIIVSRQA